VKEIQVLIEKAVVRYLNGDTAEFNRLKSTALELYAEGKCTVNRGPMVISIGEILRMKEACS
jgi:hypothetical protein